MKENRHFETVEDMIEFVLADTYNAKRRYMLRTYKIWKYVDEVAGNEWEAEHKALDWVSYSSPDYATYQATEQELRSRRPERKDAVHYHLEESGYHTRIDLSTELGEQLDAVWMKKSTRWNDTERTGWVSLSALLKRLGKTGIGKQVKAAQKAAEEKTARNQRNYARSQARKLAQEIIELREKNPDIYFPHYLADLLTMEDEDVQV